MKSIIEKEKFLEEHGWVRYGSANWMKREWQNEEETLNLPAHLCPHWYHPGETLDDAITITKEELAIAKTKKECTLENAKILERIILDAIRGVEWGDIRSAAKGFARKKLYDWYLCECNTCGMKPNPDIVKVFEPKSQPEKPSCWDNCTRIKHGTIEECQDCADRPDGYNMYNRRVG
jgi:hypothetical protein